MKSWAIRDTDVWNGGLRYPEGVEFAILQKS